MKTKVVFEIDNIGFECDYLETKIALEKTLNDMLSSRHNLIFNNKNSNEGSIPNKEIEEFMEEHDVLEDFILEKIMSDIRKSLGKLRRFPYVIKDIEYHIVRID